MLPSHPFLSCIFPSSLQRREPSSITKFCELALLLLLLSTIRVQAETETIWQIGKFDESPVEFSARQVTAVDFRVGSSDPGRDWPRDQRVGVPHHILFSLAAVNGPYVLKIATLIEQPRIPALRIDMNGHAGTFYLHPKLSYSRSDFTYAFDPHEAQSILEIGLPSSFLKAGQNRVTITLVDDPETPPGEEEIGGITYDALSLQAASASSKLDEIKIDVEPTIFFRQSGPGMTEIVDAF